MRVLILSHDDVYAALPPEACAEVCSGKRQKFLIGVKTSAVFGSEHSPDGCGFHSAEHKASKG